MRQRPALQRGDVWACVGRGSCVVTTGQQFVRATASLPSLCTVPRSFPEPPCRASSSTSVLWGSRSRSPISNRGRTRMGLTVLSILAQK